MTRTPTLTTCQWLHGSCSENAQYTVQVEILDADRFDHVPMCHCCAEEYITDYLSASSSIPPNQPANTHIDVETPVKPRELLRSPVVTRLDGTTPVTPGQAHDEYLSEATYTEHGTYAPATLRRRFGSWNEALEAADLPTRQQLTEQK